MHPSLLAVHGGRRNPSLPAVGDVHPSLPADKELAGAVHQEIPFNDVRRRTDRPPRIEGDRL